MPNDVLKTFKRLFTLLIICRAIHNDIDWKIVSVVNNMFNHAVGIGDRRWFRRCDNDAFISCGYKEYTVISCPSSHIKNDVIIKFGQLPELLKKVLLPGLVHSEKGIQSTAAGNVGKAVWPRFNDIVER